MSDLLSQMEEDFESTVASSVEKIDQGELGNVASIARRIRDKEERVSQLEQELKQEKHELLKLTDEDLPTVFAEMGLSKLSLDDGSTVEIKQTYGASIPVAERGVEFGRGEDDKASAFRAFCETEGYVPDQKTGIHPQTLRAFVRERVENGDSFPMDMFGAWVGQRATIKRS